MTEWQKMITGKWYDAIMILNCCKNALKQNRYVMNIIVAGQAVMNR